MTQNEIVQHVHHRRLMMHPRNMRRIYPTDQVARMAASIRERGVIQPLVAINGTDGQLQIVAGNLRLAAIRSMGPDAPQVPVIVRPRSSADQLLDMAAENAIRFSPDPVSEGLHYLALLDEPGMTVNRISTMTGISFPSIKNRLSWAEIEPEIQELAIAGKLAKGAAEPLLSLPAGELRIQAAERFARNRISLKTIKAACTRIRRKLANQAADPGPAAEPHPDGPAMDRSGAKPGKRHDPILSHAAVRSAAARACSTCPNQDDLGIPEPAWTILSHGARCACENCGLQTVRSFCNNCPLVYALRHTYREIVRRQGDVPHERF